MKTCLSLLLFCLAAVGVQAQVRCALAAGPVGADGKLSAKLTVEIDPGWHISSLTQPDGGPTRTEIGLAKDQPFKLAGPITGPKPHVEPSAAFGVDVETHEGLVEFVLPLVATQAVPAGTKLTVEITYQACTDENCMLPETRQATATLGTKPPGAPPADSR